MNSKSVSSVEKSVSYKATNSYAVLNEYHSGIKNIWMVFHGMGYLSRYFLRPFTTLDPNENYIIAPQAPSKYYLNDDFKYVGASWLTKENTGASLQNVLNYVDGVYTAEQISKEQNLILFGFSQGVSIVVRWMALRKIQCQQLILYAGSIPNELKREDFDFIDFNTTSVKVIYGDSDHYLTPQRLEVEKKKMDLLSRGKANIIEFTGGHEIKPAILRNLL